MKNNRIRLTSYISPDLDELIEEYMEENNISTKSQAIERMLIEFKYIRNEIDFLRGVIGGNSSNFSYTRHTASSRKSKNKTDKVMDSINDIFSNMPE